MATLSARINELATAIRDKFNQIMPRLLPPGGTTGQGLVKASNADNSVMWSNVATTSYVDNALAARPVAFGFFCGGAPVDDELIGRLIVPASVTLTSYLCRASANTAATSTAVITIRKNGTAWGTITFAAGAATASISLNWPMTVAADDILTFHAPATADATLADISATFR